LALLIKADGIIVDRRQQTVGDTTNTEAVPGPIDSKRRSEPYGMSG